MQDDDRGRRPSHGQLRHPFDAAAAADPDPNPDPDPSGDRPRLPRYLSSFLLPPSPSFLPPQPMHGDSSLLLHPLPYKP